MSFPRSGYKKTMAFIFNILSCILALKEASCHIMVWLWRDIHDKELSEVGLWPTANKKLRPSVQQVAKN